MKQAMTTAGIAILDKPEGLTSFRALGALKRNLSTKKIGHCGTLDLFASGLLLAFVEEATRLVPWFVGKDKSYTAQIWFGSQTDTLDPGGKQIASADVPSLEQILSVLPSFVGNIAQVPPAYSAIHIDGKRAYQRVLAGEEPALRPRNITIHSIDFLKWQSPVMTIQVACSSGTYIRSLARDIALACSSVAHLSGLRRTQLGSLKESDSRVCSPDQCGINEVISGRRVLDLIGEVQCLELREQFEADFKQGRAIKETWFSSLDLPIESQTAMVACQDRIVGVVTLVRQQAIRYQQVFPRGI